MKISRVRILAYLINFWSMSAVAGYQCTMTFSNVDTPEKVVAAKLISIDDGIRSGSEGKILNTVNVEAFINGQVSEEEAEILLSTETELSDKIELKGEGKSVNYFSVYRIVTSCQGSKTPGTNS